MHVCVHGCVYVRTYVYIVTLVYVQYAKIFTSTGKSLSQILCTSGDNNSIGGRDAQFPEKNKL